MASSKMLRKLAIRHVQEGAIAVPDEKARPGPCGYLAQLAPSTGQSEVGDGDM
jgi:hypothetical protein